MIDSITKERLFELMQELEDAAGMPTYDNRNYFEQSEGAYKMLKVLELNHEYVQWSMNRAIREQCRKGEY